MMRPGQMPAPLKLISVALLISASGALMVGINNPIIGGLGQGAANYGNDTVDELGDRGEQAAEGEDEEVDLDEPDEDPNPGQQQIEGNTGDAAPLTLLNCEGGHQICDDATRNIAQTIAGGTTSTVTRMTCRGLTSAPANWAANQGGDPNQAQEDFVGALHNGCGELGNFVGDGTALSVGMLHDVSIGPTVYGLNSGMDGVECVGSAGFSIREQAGCGWGAVEWAGGDVPGGIYGTGARWADETGDFVGKYSQGACQVHGYVEGGCDMVGSGTDYVASGVNTAADETGDCLDPGSIGDGDCQADDAVVDGATTVACAGGYNPLC